MSFWRSTAGNEVDFIVGDKIAIETEASKNINSKHLKGLKYLQEENLISDFYLVSQDEIEREVEGIK